MRVVLIAFFSCIGLLAASQNPFQPINLTQAVEKAKASNKLLFVQYESAQCDECNAVANKAFSNPTVAQKLISNFVCIRVDTRHPDRAAIGKTYNVEGDFGSLFIDRDKGLLYSYHRSTSSAPDFLRQIDTALARSRDSIKLSTLEKDYAHRNRNPEFIEKYLIKRRSLNLAVDSVLEEYVYSLPEDSLHAEHTLRFIASMAPVLGSAADTVLRGDQSLFNRVWYRLPLTTRVSINSTIIAKSRKKAIASRDEEYAKKVAVFAQSTFVNNYQTGVRVYEWNMLEFYKETGDTAKAIAKARNYYDTYFMVLNVDSLHRMDSLAMRKPGSPVSDTMIDGHRVQRAVSAYSPLSQFPARELLNGAAILYALGDEKDFAKAIQWCERALEFYKTADIYDQYARLLYRVQRTKEAMVAEQHAIEKAKETGYPTAGYELTLAKMTRNEKFDRK